MTNPSWVDTCKLPFLDRQAIRETDPIKCAQAIQRFADLSVYESTVGTESFCHRSSVKHLGQCSIAALAHPAMRIVYGMDNALVNSLSFPFRGVNRTKLAKDSLEIRPGQGLFRPITNEALVETGDYIGISLLFSTSLIERVVLAFDPSGSFQRKLLAALSRPTIVSCEDPVQKILMDQLRSLISLVDLSQEVQDQCLMHAQFEDLLATRFAALLLPDLVMGDCPVVKASPDGSADPDFDDLIDYIRANLSLPLSLTDLSIRSGLSRYQLDQAFRHHFGLSPRRWIREQRNAILNKMVEH